MSAKPLNLGAGAPYTVRPVMFKGLQYVVKDRTDTSVYITRSHLGATRRRDKLTEAARKCVS